MKKQTKLLMCMVAVVSLTTILLVGCANSEQEISSDLSTEELSENEISEQADTTGTTDSHVVGNGNTTEASSRTTNDTTTTTEESKGTNNQTASNSNQESRTTNTTNTTTETRNTATTTQQSTSNVGNTNNASTTASTSSGNTTTNTTANHTHDWVAVYTKGTHHDGGTYEEQRLVTQAWDEPVKEGGYRCVQCGKEFFGKELLDSTTQAHIDFITHISDCQGTGSSYCNTSRVIDYIHHDAVYETVTVTKEAYDDPDIFEYSECSICGKKDYTIIGRGAKYL